MHAAESDSVSTQTAAAPRAGRTSPHLSQPRALNPPDARAETAYATLAPSARAWVISVVTRRMRAELQVFGDGAAFGDGRGGGEPAPQARGTEPPEDRRVGCGGTGLGPALST